MTDKINAERTAHYAAVRAKARAAFRKIRYSDTINRERRIAEASVPDRMEKRDD